MVAVKSFGLLQISASPCFWRAEETRSTTSNKIFALILDVIQPPVSSQPTPHQHLLPEHIARAIPPRTSNMATVNSLPEELLVIIATSLAQRDLRDFALVARKFRHAAEEVLYKAPYLCSHYTDPADHHDTVYKLRRFAETLLRPPDLIMRVRRLDMVSRFGVSLTST
jgi:hypothetical protein